MADRIKGPWGRAERHRTEFAGDPPRAFEHNGAKSPYGQVSHVMRLRPGYDEETENDDVRLTLLFPAFDASEIPDDFVNDDLSWPILVMKNHRYAGKRWLRDARSVVRWARGYV